MSAGRDQFKSSFGTFTARERELERSRAHRDARDERDARDAVRDTGSKDGQPDPAADRPSP